MSVRVAQFGFKEGPSHRGFKGRGGFVLDASEVVRRMNELNMVILPAKIRKGLELAGKKLMTDTVTGLPTTPIRRPGYPVTDGRQAGELRASGAVFVDGAKKADSTAYGETATGKYQPEVYGGTPLSRFSHEACVVFNAPYAATQHESFPRKTEPGAGTGYMGDKIRGNAAEYITIIVEAVRL